MLSKRWQRVNRGDCLSHPHPLSCPTGTDTLWDYKGWKPVSRNALVPLLPSPASSCCRCGESQQRWNQWLWLARWSWASSPAGSVWLHTGFHRCLSQGRSKGNSSHRTHFKKPKHRNNSAETRQLQKKLQTGGTQTWVGSYLFWKGE